MDSCLRRIFLEALEVDLDFMERVNFATYFWGAVGIRDLPGAVAYDRLRRWWGATRPRPGGGENLEELAQRLRR